MRKLVAVIICCFVLATGYIAFVIAERQTALQKFARYNDSWAVSQTVAEYLRLQNKLAVFALSPGKIDRDELQLRLDIMLSRLELLKQGNLGAFINEKQQWRDLVTQLNAVLADLEQRVNRLEPSDVPAMLSAMSALDAPMTTLASSSVAYDVNLIDTAHEDVRKLHIVYTALAGGLILCGIALVILLLRQNDLLNRAQKSMRGLTDDLRAATLELQAKNVRLEHDAYHDALTGLPNRSLFRQELIERLRRSFGGSGTTAILLLDLDGFKDVNDTLGHDAGDALLQAVAQRLS
ncbi:MAG TPA: GGDEF-domain containing protein, partial [Agrobacterium sp.]|nr:GGDEF-domain containing protein [Agrobacterium sp.]